MTWVVVKVYFKNFHYEIVKKKIQNIYVEFFNHSCLCA
jgi:lantibiotic modifying enzyme